MSSEFSGEIQFSNLFSPLEVGPITVRNRICETTNTIESYGHEAMGAPDEHFIAHHVAKAKGGTAWIGSETWLLNSPLPDHAVDEFYEGAAALQLAAYQLPGFQEKVSEFCDAVHAEGSVAIFQLTHLNHALAASSVPTTNIYDYVPHSMGEEEIEFVLNTYADAAELAMHAGADGIEIHCAHETTPHTFLSPATNKRDDEWGGDAEQRSRFVIEGLKRIRERVGGNIAVGIRINGQESRQGGYDLMEFREMAYYIAETGLLDFIDVDVGHCFGVHAYVPPSYHEPAEFREAGKALKVDVGDRVKILFSGRINEPVVAEELLRSGACDLVGMTRAGIADPEFPNKVREGRMLEMRRCIGCNRCIGEAVHSRAPRAAYRPVCSVNPVIGQEVFWSENFKPAAVEKHVVVVGGGPAGLEAARVAAMRGHRVSLLEKDRALGGQMRLAYKVPGRDSFEDFFYFQENEMERLGVDVRLECDADVAMIDELSPDVVICATGSTPRTDLEAEGLDSGSVVMGRDLLRNPALAGQRVALVSQESYFETPNIAEFLAEKGRQVEIFHMWTQIGSEIDRYSIGTVMKRLEETGVKIHTGLRLSKVEGSTVTCVSAYTGQQANFDGFDTVALVYGSVPESALHEQLQAAGSVKELYIAGSAWVPRRIAEATSHGARIALAI